MKRFLPLPIVAALVLPLAALAESNVNPSTPSNGTAQARVDVKITVPRVLFLQVGTGTVMAAGTTVDLMDFQVPASGIGNSTSVAATAASGDQANGSVTVRVLANGNSNVSLNSSTTGAMTNGAGSTIGWDQIDVTASALATTTSGYTNAAITHPAFNSSNTGAGTATTLTATSGLVRQEGKWTYAYKNQNVVAAGTYGGASNTNNGTVTYTATMP
ncbi:hypothetical protein VAR608DRAFT_3000 [Variovorax sp. HW608]|uniref:hypothetical protein n=1 Tax=Variovorax sp. HW608 TaxID=1034889 RepID=UPI00081F8EC1|nr:hypothetical protein [Variovorax sp. HW608]SCK33786.1 hypothetical protein VAR608DRAFT_3000 [Variovorax sp. HW608]